MPAGRSLNVRTTALVLAIGINSLYLLAFWLDHDREPVQTVIPAVAWIVAALEPRSSSRGSAVQPVRPASVPVPVLVSPEVVPEPGPEPEPEPEAEAGEPVSMAALGWSAAAAEVARNYARREEQRRRESPPADEETTGQAPYRAGVPRKKGEHEQLEGGVVRTWVSDLCYYERDPLIAQGAARKVCKIRSAAERLSTHLAEELEKAVKPRYLGGERTLPDEPDSHIRIP